MKNLNEVYNEVYDEAYTNQYGFGPFVAADALVFNDKLEVLVIRRSDDKNEWALPGGFMEPAERPVDAAVREMNEETGVSRSDLSFVGIFSSADPLRDPRAHIISFVSVFMLNPAAKPAVYPKDGEALEVRWIPIVDLLDMKMYADHASLVVTGMKMAADVMKNQISAPVSETTGISAVAPFIIMMLMIIYLMELARQIFFV